MESNKSIFLIFFSWGEGNIFEWNKSATKYILTKLLLCVPCQLWLWNKRRHYLTFWIFFD